MPRVVRQTPLGGRRPQVEHCHRTGVNRPEPPGGVTQPASLVLYPACTRPAVGQAPTIRETHMLALNLLGTKEIIVYIVVVVVIIVAAVWYSRSRSRV